MITQATLEACCKDLAFNSNDRAFAERVFNTPIERYQQRLIELGFDNRDDVADIGAGFGQWTLALASLCNRVDAIEACPMRCAFLNRLLAAEGIDHVHVIHDQLPTLSEIDSTYDGIFCYSTILITPWRDSLMTMLQRLKSKGLLYLNFNCWGWYLYLWEQQPNKNPDYQPRQVVRDALTNTIHYTEYGEARGHMLIDAEDVLALLKTQPLSSLRHGPEGSITVKEGEPQGFLLSHYRNIEAVYEILAES